MCFYSRYLLGESNVELRFLTLEIFGLSRLHSYRCNCMCNFLQFTGIPGRNKKRTEDQNWKTSKKSFRSAMNDAKSLSIWFRNKSRQVEQRPSLLPHLGEREFSVYNIGPRMKNFTLIKNTLVDFLVKFQLFIFFYKRVNVSIISKQPSYLII